MDCAGIICEYNPLHTGHIYHMREAARSAGGGVVCVLSGALVQRGEPAVADPWTRARWALEAGADMVLYLPVVYSLAPADVFARGGVMTLGASGVVDAFAFGSESGDAKAIEACAALLADEPDRFRAVLRSALAEGVGYPAALTRAMADCPPEGMSPELAERIMKSPNDALGVRYCMENRRLAKPMRPIVVRRDESHCSASVIRGMLARGLDVSQYVPHYVANTLDRGARGADYFDAALCVGLRALSPWTLRDLPDAEQTAAESLMRAIHAHASASAIVDAVASKRYTRARIRRMLWYATLGETNALRGQVKARLPYIRVLGVRRDKSALLSRMARTARAPVLTTGRETAELCDRDPYAGQCGALDALALDICALSDPDPRGRAAGTWYTQRMITL